MAQAKVFECLYLMDVCYKCYFPRDQNSQARSSRSQRDDALARAARPCGAALGDERRRDREVSPAQKVSAAAGVLSPTDGRLRKFTFTAVRVGGRASTAYFSHNVSLCETERSTTTSSTIPCRR